MSGNTATSRQLPAWAPRFALAVRLNRAADRHARKADDYRQRAEQIEAEAIALRDAAQAEQAS